MAEKYLSVVGFEDDVDLRTISGRSSFLRRVERSYKMKDLGVVCFTNKVHTRFRLVLKIRGVMLMCVPEIDDKTKYSTYLRVNEALTHLGGLSSPLIELDNLSSFTKGRIKRVQSLKKNKRKKKV